ncbi:MAG TPA: hypothetical protein DEA08_39480 [Planctomycetes bacterium]|nr:hypothetical protein [Planctomycetota bacterium]
MKRVRSLAPLLALTCLCTSAAADDLRDALRDYRRSISRPALYLRVKAIEALAKTRDPKALKQLVRRYKRPEPPEQHVRYLVAGVSAESFTGDEHGEAWATWLDKEDAREDAWLWYLGQRVRARHAGSAPLLEAIASAKLDPFLRAASLHALARTESVEATLKAISSLLAEGGPEVKKKDELGRAVLVEACAAALSRCGRKRGTPEFSQAIERVIDQLERDDLLPRTPWVIGRRLATTLGVEELYTSADAWRKLLAVKQANQAAEGTPGRTRLRSVSLGPGRSVPRFFGIEGTGSRVAFLIDCSDSMLKPLTEEEKEEIKRRPVTGSARRHDKGGKPQADPPAQPRDQPEQDELSKKLPWERIHSRFDAAREALKLSLQALGPKMQYVVITFGQYAELLGQGLAEASPRNVKLTLRKLDAIQAKRGGPDRPHGTLMGYTNLHGALLDAFQVTERGQLDELEHLAERGFSEGIETIYVLSDGAPSWDDFEAVDRNDQDLSSGDPETGKAGGKSPTLNYYGPYVFVNHLLRDVIRLNLFRQAEIHCIGIGEANPRLLQVMSDVGLGQFRSISSP